jgi:hypothetical protein
MAMAVSVIQRTRFISEKEHKHHLLMYHDRRFQLDLHFPMVAFKDAQIKQSKTGSDLLVDHKKFDKLRGGSAILIQRF